jgi:hypothetical protein
MAKTKKIKKWGKHAGGNSTLLPTGESVSGYFRQVFEENPKLLKSGSNQEVFRRWLEDHPDETEVPKKVKQILSNVKSILRSKRRRKRASVDNAPTPAESIRPITPPANQGLESLEADIDECLIEAKSLDREGLESVINHLRLARNEVVLKLG